MFWGLHKVWITTSSLICTWTWSCTASRHSSSLTTHLSHRLNSQWIDFRIIEQTTTYPANQSITQRASTSKPSYFQHYSRTRLRYLPITFTEKPFCSQSLQSPWRLKNHPTRLASLFTCSVLLSSRKAWSVTPSNSRYSIGQTISTWLFSASCSSCFLYFQRS
jgi:hypothetical protein